MHTDTDTGTGTEAAHTETQRHRDTDTKSLSTPKIPHTEAHRTICMALRVAHWKIDTATGHLVGSA
eukprot:2670464-Rhodomonas_salina.1